MEIWKKWNRSLEMQHSYLEQELEILATYQNKD